MTYNDGDIVNGHRYDRATNSWVPLPPAAGIVAEPAKRRTGLKVAAGIGGTLLVLAVAGAALGSGEPDTAASAVPSASASTPAPSLPVTGPDEAAQRAAADIADELESATGAFSTAVDSIAAGEMDSALLREQAQVIRTAASRMQTLSVDLPDCQAQATQVAVDGLRKAADSMDMAADGIDTVDPGLIDDAAALMTRGTDLIGTGSDLLEGCGSL